jgi:hypothetical protein
MNALWNIHTVEYYTIIKKSTQVLPAIRMNLMDVKMRERTQTQGSVHCVIYMKFKNKQYKVSIVATGGGDGFDRNKGAFGML